MTYVGRYLKALIDRPYGGNVKAGQYGLIQRDDLSHIRFPDHSNYCATSSLREPEKMQLMPEGWKPGDKDPFVNSIGKVEYVKCIKGDGTSNFDIIGKVYKVDSYDKNIGHIKILGHTIYNIFFAPNSNTTDYEISTEEAYLSQKIDKWVPKVGEYAIMEQAGGWGYSPDNNGCIAIIEKVNTRTVNGSFNTYCIDGRILDPKNKDKTTFREVPILSRKSDIVSVVCRKAHPHEIPSSTELQVGDWVVFISSDTSYLKKGAVTQVTFHGNHNGILKLMTPELDKEYPTKTGWQYAKNFRLALPNEISSAITSILSSFPQEGCVYYDKDINDLYSLSKYLTSRPYNRADGKTEIWEAVGIGWNANSCWWLKTKASCKTVYNLKDIQHLYPQQTRPNVKPMENILKLDDSHLGSIISCKWGDRHYNECLFIKEDGCYYLLNNVTTNNDGHKDKSKYKYSLLFYNLEALNKSVKNIKLLDTYDIGVFTAQYDISTRTEILERYPYPASHNPCGEISLSSNNGMVSLTIPEVRKVPIKVDYSISVKLADIQLPDFSVKPKKIEVIKIEPYNICL